MSAELLTRLLEQSTFYVTANTTDLRPGDGLVEAPNGGSSLNWLLGHIVYWRNHMIERAGGTPPWRDGAGRQYRGNPGERRPKDFDPATAMALSDLKSGFTESGRRLASALATKHVEPDVLTDLIALVGHEIYHAGQLGVMRRIAGRDGAL